MHALETNPGSITEAESRSVWSWPLRASLIAGLVIAAVVIATVARTAIKQKSLERDQEALLAFSGLHDQVQQSLDAVYADLNEDLLADPPTDPAQWISPQPLVLAHYLGDDEGTSRVDWTGLGRLIAEETGREVEVQAYLHTPEELDAIAVGKIQLIAAHSAEIPRLVNKAGIMPFAELASDDAVDGNRLIVAVGADSKAESLEALRGSTLVCTEPDSLTGYRAAIVCIYLETGMKPNIDYEIYFSHKHKQSIRGVAINKFPFIALSNDVLDRMLELRHVKSDEYRVLYESDPIPRLAIGHIHSLSPQLVEKVKAAVFAFQNDGAAFRFRGIDYKGDYELARRLDDAFEPRFGQIFMLDRLD